MTDPALHGSWPRPETIARRQHAIQQHTNRISIDYAHMHETVLSPGHTTNDPNQGGHQPGGHSDPTGNLATRNTNMRPAKNPDTGKPTGQHELANHQARALTRWLAWLHALERAARQMSRAAADFHGHGTELPDTSSGIDRTQATINRNTTSGQKKLRRLEQAQQARDQHLSDYFPALPPATLQHLKQRQHNRQQP